MTSPGSSRNSAEETLDVVRASGVLNLDAPLSSVLELAAKLSDEAQDEAELTHSRPHTDNIIHSHFIVSHSE